MNQKKRLTRILALLLCLTMLFALTLHAGADFGDFAGDSDYGSDSDYGGFDSDYSSDYSGSNNDGDLPGGIGSYVFFVIVAIIVIGYLIANSGKRKKKNNGSSSQQHTSGSSGSAQTRGQTPTGGAQYRSLRPISEYAQYDPSFNSAAMTEKLSNLYVQMQNAWQDKDISSLQPYLSGALYGQMDRQLEALRKRNRTNYIERIAVLSVALKGFYQDGGRDHIVAELRTRIVDYTLSDEDGSLISGSRTAEKFMTYEWQLSRETGLTTQTAQGMQNVSCPSCGAPLSINESAKCPYCGTVVKLESKDFVIDSMRGISQRTSN